MHNTDTSANRDALRTAMQRAAASGDSAAFAQAFEDLAIQIGEELRQEFADRLEATQQMADGQVMAGRGIRQLTSKEREYYQKLIGCMQASDPKQALTGANLSMPVTIVNTVFDELQTEHPLLSIIDFVPSGGALRMIMDTNGNELATWGALCDEIVKEIAAGFKLIDGTLYKLSAFLPVCKAMLELGAEWLDRYVREVLYEAIANGMEGAIVNGDGNGKPIGMTRQVGPNVTVTGGVYPKKEAIEVTDLRPATVGRLVAMLAVGENGKPRNLSGVLLICNSVDYWQKVMPATTVLAPDGTYRNGVTPFPMTILPSPALAQGEAVLGIARGYFAAAGTPKDGRIEYSDHYHFVEDERLYIIKVYAYGRPKTDKDFLRLDISGLRPAILQAELITPPDPSDDATLSALTIGSLTLTPAFDPDEDEYTADTDTATAVINATVANAGATVAITLTNTTHSTGIAVDNGSSMTFDEGENVIAITVTAEDGTTTETYEVTVTLDSDG